MARKSSSQPLVVRQGIDLEWLFGALFIAACGGAGLWAVGVGHVPPAAVTPFWWVSAGVLGIAGLAFLGWLWGRINAEELHIGPEALELRMSLTGAVVGYIPMDNLTRVEFATRVLQSGRELEYVGLELAGPDDEETFWPGEARSFSEFDHAIFGGFTMPLEEIAREVRKRLRRAQGAD